MEECVLDQYSVHGAMHNSCISICCRTLVLNRTDAPHSSQDLLFYGLKDPTGSESEPILLINL